ncbi:glycoside hydrolase family 57 protein [Nitrospira moscoviensis]|uniref:Glycoside hydrolase, family 57 n=1 Tax=Nitrospira moscoviensis TaxID=42253 RepID=A0A0K2GH10_NITMO|nr:glycoside hydrolase family 57 protein [Nitrospira moscoviensis]ALA60134.1 Glycoside hydrolase, family 57 [Nitrospira moscoviensis]
MKTVHVCFVWHMHQPYYTDPVGGSASMPWVRLHATKAYYDMASLLETFPSVRATFNFTPSLLRQLEEIGSGAVRDLFLEHARRPAAELTDEEKAFLIRHFFAANWATMVRPYPRYHELLVKRGLDVNGRDLERLARRFSAQELLDLQVWHNLAWFGYGTVRRYPRLAALRHKNRGFTEEEKQEVLALQQAAVRDIVPLYRRLLERGQVELTTTPFFHPIMPLVIDTDINRRARPDLPLPARFRAPDDAAAQLARAVDAHRRTFGRAPAGLWPSEGSVCPEVIPLAHRAGLRWLATDEGVLARSLEQSGRAWHRPQALYRPYRVGEAGGELTIVFRDRELSDAFGFVYHKTDPDSAADDVLRRLRTIIHDVPQERLLIAVILDGENPWEHYHDGGERFLSLLYGAFANQALDREGRIRVQASTMSDALAAGPPAEHLPMLHSGSWINQDFKIWIGHHEDNRAWDLLGHTRTRLVDLAPSLPADRAEAAWDELYAAEGSDWFWWYGDDFDTDFKHEFDRLFRTHLRNVWLHLGLTPPADLHQPISVTRHLEGDRIIQPLRLLDPALDGVVTDFFEWRGAGSIDTQPPLGAMWRADRLFTAIRFGWNREQLFLRLDPGDGMQARTGGVVVAITLQTAERTFRLTFSPAPSDPARFMLSEAIGAEVWRDIGPYHSMSRKKIFELAVPWKDLEADPGRQIRLSIVVSEHGLEIARYPHHQPAVLTVPGPEFEAGLWRV